MLSVESTKLSLPPAPGSRLWSVAAPLGSAADYSQPTTFQEASADMTWSTPAYEDLRLGFEINLYINNR
ncbi:coenzyme PQQ precursor peptide PqqA (plasmid) [Candidatus Thiodictyon syntrophicum]|uniref:Coenzyme PQQ synthesis protein A n=1 Tax=Candidatus Thiodictyon syntrophicum TaxID=1166950 RepID=A0A2K8UJ52_9GAMM|nr:coenzyme PQQ precursor peptide PqqA [Candidatus Thiodictyon syntrophicum]